MTKMEMGGGSIPTKRSRHSYFPLTFLGDSAMEEREEATRGGSSLMTVFFVKSHSKVSVSSKGLPVRSQKRQTSLVGLFLLLLVIQKSHAFSGELHRLKSAQRISDSQRISVARTSSQYFRQCYRPTLSSSTLASLHEHNSPRVEGDPETEMMCDPLVFDQDLSQGEFDSIMANCVANDQWDSVLQLLDQDSSVATENNGPSLSTETVHLKPTRSTFHTCLQACYKKPNAASALEIMHAMDRAGFAPNATDVELFVNTSLHSCDSEENRNGYRSVDWRNVVKILNQYDATISVDKYNQILACMAEEREWKDAIIFLRSMETKNRDADLQSYETVIECCIRSNQPEQAFQVLRTCLSIGHTPSSKTFESISTQLSKRSQWRRAKQLLDLMVEKRIRISLSLYNSVITACSRAGEVSQAKNILFQMKRDEVYPDVLSYNSLIACCAKNGYWKQALTLLDQCQREGVIPDIYTYTNAIRACAKGGKIERAMSLFQVAKDKKLQIDVYAYTAAIEAYSKAGRWQNALELLEEMEKGGIEPSSITYSVTISACGNGGNWEMALELLERMRRKSLSINLITYNSAITALSKAAKRHSKSGLNSILLWKRAVGLLEQMKNDGIEPDGFSYSSAITCCGAEGQWEEALNIIEIMQNGDSRSFPNKVAYTAAISSCGRAGRVDEALRLFQQMRQQGISADIVAYNALFSAFRVSKRASDAHELWMEMLGRKDVLSKKSSGLKFRSRVEPDIITLTGVIGAMSADDSQVWKSRVDEVFQEAVDRHLVLSDDSLDSRYEHLEYDLTGMSFPVARAACRYIVQSVIGRLSTGEDIKDLSFITGVGKASSDENYTSLREYIQGVLRKDFVHPIVSEMPRFAKGTVFIGRPELEKLF